jgi:hypothetical protein
VRSEPRPRRSPRELTSARSDEDALERVSQDAPAAERLALRDRALDALE